MQASQIARNVTTNELANWPRYKYLRSADGSFNNPFDRGCKQNCLETMSPQSAPAAPVVLPSDPLESAALLSKLVGENCQHGCSH